MGAAGPGQHLVREPRPPLETSALGAARKASRRAPTAQQLAPAWIATCLDRDALPVHAGGDRLVGCKVAAAAALLGAAAGEGVAAVWEGHILRLGALGAHKLHGGDERPRGRGARHCAAHGHQPADLVCEDG